MHADSFLFSLTKLLYILLSFVFPILNSYCVFILKPSIDRKIEIFQFLGVYVLLHFTLSFSRKNYVFFFQTSGFIGFKESKAFLRHAMQGDILIQHKKITKHVYLRRTTVTLRPHPDPPSSILYRLGFYEVSVLRIFQIIQSEGVESLDLGRQTARA